MRSEVSMGERVRPWWMPCPGHADECQPDYSSFHHLEFMHLMHLVKIILKIMTRTTLHCCYQGDFQEVNIPMNRALLPNCKIESTACLFLKNLKKNWAFKKMFGQFGIPRNARGHILPKKVFLVWSVFVSKNGYFFLHLPFFTTKWPARLTHFGPELPTGVMKIDF